MKSTYFAVPALLLAFCALAPAQTDRTHPTGTTVTQKHADGSTEVQPDFKQAPLSENDVIDAQKKLNSNGYQAGPEDGKFGPHTRAAVRKYQQDNNIAVSGKLDESTRTHLNVGAGKTMASAPSAIGNGAKAAGHNFKEGHPLAAAKSLGKGFGHASKSVAEGTKSGVMGSKDKIAGNKGKSENGNQSPR